MRWILSCLMLVAISTPALAQNAQNGQAASAEGVRTPLVVKWTTAELKPGSLRIVARIERTTQFALPLTVSVVVPAGARLISGPAAFQVPAGTPAGKDEQQYVLQFERAPAEDLKLVADLQTSSFGVHAEDVYRFGRKAPELPQVSHTGPAVHSGGFNLGPSVRMPAPTK